ncbi:MAG: glycine cleavage system aminomethyltransferase GcvT [Planctomycetes bacterium]|nr:glycine cleavage system aminomethyltransferase GcvT [Planctomycetota bacterium]
MTRISPATPSAGTADFLFLGSLAETDAEVERLVRLEEERQARKLILIASESICPRAVREASASVFGNIYAEGYPSWRMTGPSNRRPADYAHHLAHLRRYSDARYYKGCDFADFVETLAQKRCAELFATESVPADRIHANVQPLSGAAANNAAYMAFVKPGGVVLGMHLSEGGHLTHGSPSNRSGKFYRIVSYGVDPRTGRLDYYQVRHLAAEHRPQMVIAGTSAYPWTIDWTRLREICDGAPSRPVLLADVSHPAGLIAAGLFPSPMGLADVVTFTTHKTLCGPRGAVILTTDEEKAKRIDAAVFPGEQGGPHIDRVAAKAVAFELARTDRFRALMRRVAGNARALAETFLSEGLSLVYGGTDSHLLLVDLKAVPSPTGFPLTGEIASRVLDLVGIVCNKNAVRGDTNAAHPTALRFGTTWVSQRGFGAEEMGEIARIVTRALREIHPFHYVYGQGTVGRGKIDFDLWRDLRGAVETLEAKGARETEDLPSSGYPFCDSPAAGSSPALTLRGERCHYLLQSAVTSDLSTLAAGQAKRTVLLEREGRYLGDVVVARLEDEAPGFRRYLVLTSAASHERVRSWLRALSDGYTLFDAEDVFKKVEGPGTVDEVAEAPERLRRRVPSAFGPTLAPPVDAPPGTPGVAILASRPDLFDLDKVYFVGQHELLEKAAHRPARKTWTWTPPSSKELRRTPLFERHKALTRQGGIVPFAGWEMPVRYASILEEHRAVREAAGLFDVAHMGVLEVAGDHAQAFLDAVTANYVAWLADGQGQYSFLLDPDGRCVDDIIVYRRAWDRYMVVVNAANAEEDLDWIRAAASGEYAIDCRHPAKRAEGPVTIRDLKDLSSGADRRVDLALQGPRSFDVLAALAGPGNAERVGLLKRFEFADVRLAGIDVMASRTGYTGEPVGYELYVHPDRLVDLWDRILEAGKPMGVKPCGLGARDSTRMEAGFPLHGHELAGEHKITPFEAGYGSFVALHKPFFVGRRAMLASFLERKMAVARFELTEPEARLVRAHDPVANLRGQAIGRVTSSTAAGGLPYGLAYVDARFAEPGTEVVVFRLPPRPVEEKPKERLEPGDPVVLHVRGRILSRFADFGGR